MVVTERAVLPERLRSRLPSWNVVHWIETVLVEGVTNNLAVLSVLMVVAEVTTLIEAKLVCKIKVEPLEKVSVAAFVVNSKDPVLLIVTGRFELTVIALRVVLRVKVLNPV